jgi:hypothetical protein
MIPHPVAVIAKQLGLEFKGSEEDGLEYYIDVAWAIYNKLKTEYDI